MRLSRRTLSLGLIMVLAAVCSLPSLGASRNIEFIYLAGSQTWEDAYAAITEAFERSNPDIKVERTRVQTNFGDRLVALIASGTVPDVLALDIQDLMSYADERFLYDLNPFIEKTPSYQVRRMAEPIVQAYTVDGKLFAAPVLTNPSLYGYNVEIFDLAGLAYPTDHYRKGSWNWQTFRDMAKKTTRKGPDGRLDVVGSILHLPRTWMSANGGAEFDDPKRPTKSLFDSKESVEALDYLHQMIWQDEAMLVVGSPLTRAFGANETVAFAQGKIAMSSRWMSGIPGFAEGGFDIGLVPLPKGPSPRGQYATDLGMFGVAISRETKDVDAAWRYVSYMTGPAGSAIDAKLPGRTPPRPVPLTWLPASVINPEIYPDLLIYGNLRVISRDRVALQRVINSGLTPLWNNTMDPQTAATEISRQLDAYLQQNPQ